MTAASNSESRKRLAESAAVETEPDFRSAIIRGLEARFKAVVAACELAEAEARHVVDDEVYVSVGLIWYALHTSADDSVRTDDALAEAEIRGQMRHITAEMVRGDQPLEEKEKLIADLRARLSHVEAERDDLAARLEQARAEGAAEVVARVEALADWLETERDSIRAAYIGHNAGRAADRPVKRPDLSTWANAYEVAAHRLRAALRGDA